MKISQHNWNWWFIITIIMLIGCFQSVMVGYDSPTITALSVISFISLLACLYVGTKPANKEH